MTTPADDNSHRVVKFVQELLVDMGDRAAVTPALIGEKIDLVLTMMPKWGEQLDREGVTDELIRRFSLWVGQDSTLQSAAGHEAWLTAARKKEWRYWQRYREYLEGSLSWKAVEALDRSTDSVLGLLEDPKRLGPWDRRGLVVGHVQSGKTGNYTGIISKAADAGYKIIIVLAGLHNNLRSQTQIRLDEGFLGYETTPVPDAIKIIGVGEIDADPAIRPNFATNRSENGDFNTAVARNLGITPEQRPWLFVVKKNKTVLERLYGWILNHVANAQDPQTGRKTVTHLPLLLIDDEADHASVDTGEQVFNPDGSPDLEHEPKRINKCVRQILHAFSRSAYVGYTATPFANIFIHERGETRDEGPDLFPSAFIINLAAPSDYIGPAQVFGLMTSNGRQGGLPLARPIEDHETKDGHGWMPSKHKNGHTPLYDGRDGLPPSLIEAVDSFLLACVARHLRGDSHAHVSMLIHVTRFNSVQEHVHRQVDEHVRHVKQRLLRRIDQEEVLQRLKGLWKRDVVPTTRAVRNVFPGLVGAGDPSWEEIEAALPDAIADIDVRMINGTAKDALDYAERHETGLKVIAIGGDKLSRGLTLEGLCVSYFLRASKMYDTLMQMGRWFGYRPGYLDLCRLYTTSDLHEWFEHITAAGEELREEFDVMAASGATPREYGLKVQSHSVLMVTSRLKMRSARSLMLSFSGQLMETVSLYRDPEVLKRNLEAARSFVRGLGKPVEGDKIVRHRAGIRNEWQGLVYEGVSPQSVIDFLIAYRTHPEAYKVNSAMLAEFIRSMNVANELSRWTVAVIGGGTGAATDVGNGTTLNMLQRKGVTQADRYSIGRLLSPRDEAIDLSEAEWKAALELTRESWRADPARLQQGSEPDVPNGPAVRKIRGFGAPGSPGHQERGLLLVYFLDPRPEWTGLPIGAPEVAAIGLSFPGSNAGVKVEYKINNVLWEQEYGPAQ
jgi:hypothetical protein